MGLGLMAVALGRGGRIGEEYDQSFPSMLETQDTGFIVLYLTLGNY